MKFRENEHIVLGIPILFLSFIGLSWNSFWLFQYIFTNKLFFYQISNYILIINITLCIIGMILGIETIRKSIKTNRSLLFFLIALTFYIGLNNYANWF